MTSVCVTPDGKHLTDRDKTGDMWSLEDGQMVKEFKGHDGGVSSVCVTPDGKHLVTGSDDKTARMCLLYELIIQIFNQKNC